MLKTLAELRPSLSLINWAMRDTIQVYVIGETGWFTMGSSKHYHRRPLDGSEYAKARELLEKAAAGRF